MCRYPDRPLQRDFAEQSANTDANEEDPLKDETVTFVPFCFQLPRLLPKCSKAKLLFSTFVQGELLLCVCVILAETDSFINDPIFDDHTEFGVPLQYTVTAADWCNNLLFDLLTRQLSNLGHREVVLQDSECQLLLEYLHLQAAADPLSNREEDGEYNGQHLPSNFIHYYTTN